MTDAFFETKLLRNSVFCFANRKWAIIYQSAQVEASLTRDKLIVVSATGQDETR